MSLTIISSLRTGLAACGRRPKLVAALWAWSLLVALAASLPLFRWLSETVSRSAEAEVLARRFSFGLFFELQQVAEPALAMVWGAALGALVLGLLANPLLAGGILEVLGSRDDRPFLHRFCRGAGHFYGRFLRLLLFSTVAAGILASLTAAALGAALKPLRESAWEPGAQAAVLIVVAAVVAVLALFWLALDYARIQVSRDDSHRMWRAFLSGLRFTLRYRGRTFGLLAATWALLGILAAAYLAFRSMVPSHTAGLIALMFAAQQAFVLARTGLRVATLAAEREMHLALRPAVGLAPLPVAEAWPEPALAPPPPVIVLPAEPHPSTPELAR
jgi:hypothetical protein